MAPVSAHPPVERMLIPRHYLSPPLAGVDDASSIRPTDRAWCPAGWSYSTKPEPRLVSLHTLAMTYTWLDRMSRIYAIDQPPSSSSIQSDRIGVVCDRLEDEDA